MSLNIESVITCQSLKSDSSKCEITTETGSDMCLFHLLQSQLQKIIDSESNIDSDILSYVRKNTDLDLSDFPINDILIKNPENKVILEEIYNFGMYTNNGNLKVLELINESISKYANNADRYRYVQGKLERLAEMTVHTEADDTMVLDFVSEYLEKLD